MKRILIPTILFIVSLPIFSLELEYISFSMLYNDIDSETAIAESNESMENYIYFYVREQSRLKVFAKDIDNKVSERLRLEMNTVKRDAVSLCIFEPDGMIKKYEISFFSDNIVKVNDDKFYMYEDSDSFDIMAALTQTSFNAVNLSKPGIQLLEKSKYVANLLFNTNYSTVCTKRRLKDTDKTDKQKLMRKALIHVLQGGRDYSNGGVRWDGVDFVTRGVNHPKAKGEGGISITKILWDDLIENWFPTSDSCFEYPTGISNTKDSCANNIPFLKANSTDIERQIQAQQIKNDCSNLWQVTETLLETEGTGKFNKGNILNKATAVIGKTIFWGTNNTDPKNKGYSWKYLLTSGWFKL